MLIWIVGFFHCSLTDWLLQLRHYWLDLLILYLKLREHSRNFIEYHRFGVFYRYTNKNNSWINDKFVFISKFILYFISKYIFLSICIIAANLTTGKNLNELFKLSVTRRLELRSIKIYIKNIQENKNRKKIRLLHYVDIQLQKKTKRNLLNY